MRVSCARVNRKRKRAEKGASDGRRRRRRGLNTRERALNRDAIMSSPSTRERGGQGKKIIPSLTQHRRNFNVRVRAGLAFPGIFFFTMALVASRSAGD